MNTEINKTVRAKRSRAAGPVVCHDMRRPSSRRRPRLTNRQLDELHKSLLASRDELVSDILQIDSELHDTQADQDKSDELDYSSKYEQADVTAGLLQTGWNELREINDALTRIDTGAYGICLATGDPIGIERLRARPWAKYCIEYARTLEKSRSRKAVG